MSTKKRAAARAVNWRKALREGRVVRYLDGQSLKAFPTAEAAQEFANELRATDETAHREGTQRVNKLMITAWLVIWLALLYLVILRFAGV